MKEEKMKGGMRTPDWFRLRSYKNHTTPLTFLALLHFNTNKDENECWNWGGSKDKKGYPQVRQDNKLYYVTRLMCMLYHGLDLANTEIQANHKCDNPSCVNPTHLFIGTQKDNIQDMLQKNRQQKQRRCRPNKKDMYIISLKRKNVSLKEISKRTNFSESYLKTIFSTMIPYWIKLGTYVPEGDDMRICPDFSEAAEGFEPLPVGEYPARVVDVEAKTSQAGNPYLNWKLAIEGAQGEYAKFNGRWVFNSTPVQGKGAFRLKDMLVATLGAAREFETEEVLGKQVRVSIDQRKSEDGTKTYADVRAVRAL